MNNRFYTLITGASEGLGKAMAIECARRQMNLVLVALPGSELSQLAGFISRNFNVCVTVFEKDLSNESDCYALYQEVSMQQLNVNMLINNAGIGSTAPFGETNPGFFEKQIRLNVLATTLITRLFLPDLEKRFPSYILNVGSLCSFFYLPKKQVYGGTKSFIYFFFKKPAAGTEGVRSNRQRALPRRHEYKCRSIHDEPRGKLVGAYFTHEPRSGGADCHP